MNEKKHNLELDAIQPKLLFIEEERLEGSYKAEGLKYDSSEDQDRPNAIGDIQRRKAERARYLESQGVIWERNAHIIRNRHGFCFDNRLRKRLGLLQLWDEITIGWNSLDISSSVKDHGNTEEMGTWTLGEHTLDKSL